MISAKELQKDVMERFGFKILTIKNIWDHNAPEPFIVFYEIEIEYADQGYSKVSIPYEDHSWNNSVDMVMWFQEKVYNHIYGI
jgi:hypothetical protein